VRCAAAGQRRPITATKLPRLLVRPSRGVVPSTWAGSVGRRGKLARGLAVRLAGPGRGGCVLPRASTIPAERRCRIQTASARQQYVRLTRKASHQVGKTHERRKATLETYFTLPDGRASTAPYLGQAWSSTSLALVAPQLSCDKSQVRSLFLSRSTGEIDCNAR
jgi:hypothetical protein